MAIFALGLITNLQIIQIMKNNKNEILRISKSIGTGRLVENQ